MQFLHKHIRMDFETNSLFSKKRTHFTERLSKAKSRRREKYLKDKNVKERRCQLKIRFEPKNTSVILHKDDQILEDLHDEWNLQEEENCMLYYIKYIDDRRIEYSRNCIETGQEPDWISFEMYLN